MACMCCGGGKRWVEGGGAFLACCPEQSATTQHVFQYTALMQHSKIESQEDVTRALHGSISAVASLSSLSRRRQGRRTFRLRRHPWRIQLRGRRYRYRRCAAHLSCGTVAQELGGAAQQTPAASKTERPRERRHRRARETLKGKGRGGWLVGKTYEPPFFKRRCHVMASFCPRHVLDSFVFLLATKRAAQQMDDGLCAEQLSTF